MLNNEPAQETRRQREKRLKLGRIEAAARRLFAKHGFEATTTRAIAEAADIGAGTLFVYFPEKLDLLFHLFHQDLGRISEDAIDALPEGVSFVEGVARVFDALYQFYEKDKALARTFIKELNFATGERHQELLNQAMRFHSRLAELVAAAQARGEVRSDVGSPLVANQLFSTYYWGLVGWLTGSLASRRQISGLMRMSIELLMRGLTPPESHSRKGGQ